MAMLLMFCFIVDVNGYTNNHIGHSRYLCDSISSSSRRSMSNDLGGNFLSRSLFAATEIIGKITNSKNNNSNSITKSKIKRKTVEQVGEAIKAEYEQIFWATV